MTLATSGTMSIGGTTTDRSINVELGRSATATSSLGETDLRSLAGVSSGAISMSNFYGAANYQWVVTVTNQATTIFGQSFQGYGNVGSTAFALEGLGGRWLSNRASEECESKQSKTEKVIAIKYRPARDLLQKWWGTAVLLAS